MLKGTKTLATLSHQLHRSLEGEEIKVKDIPKMDHHWICFQWNSSS
jgi:hypothetical protein